MTKRNLAKLALLLLLAPLLGGCAKASSPPLVMDKPGAEETRPVPAAHQPIPASGSATPVVASTADATIVISKSPERVARRQIDKQPPTVRKHNDADTVWVFHIAPELAYDILSRTANGKRYSVELKITGAKITLGLDLTYYLGKNVNQSVLEHEYGHAAMARHKYAQAEEIARVCAGQIVGRTFKGEGDNLDAACVAATTQAAQILARAYEEKTNGYVTRASTLYDQLERHGLEHDRSQKNIQKAEAAAAKG